MAFSRAPHDSLWLKLISSLRVVVIALWTVVWTTLALLVYLVTRRHSVSLAVARVVWAPGVLAMTGARVKVTGLERVDFSRQHLFVANHTSQLDIPVLFAVLPVPLRFLAKAELRRVPLISHYIAAMGMVMIDRKQSDAARASVDRLAELLRDGKSLMAFPEGTRNPDEEIQLFKTGAFVAAIKSGVPVVPIRIVGAGEVLPARSLAIRSGPVEVILGEPIPSEGMNLEDRRGLADRVRSSMVDLAPAPNDRRGR